MFYMDESSFQKFPKRAIRKPSYGLVEYSIFMSLGSAIIEKFDLFEKIPIKNIYALSYGIGTSDR